MFKTRSHVDDANRRFSSIFVFIHHRTNNLHLCNVISTYIKFDVLSFLIVIEMSIVSAIIDIYLSIASYCSIFKLVDDSDNLAIWCGYTCQLRQELLAEYDKALIDSFRSCKQLTFKMFAWQIWVHPVPPILDAATNMLNARNIRLALMLPVSVRPIIRLLKEFAKQVRYVWNALFLLIVHIHSGQRLNCFSTVNIEIMFPQQIQLHTE